MAELFDQLNTIDPAVLTEVVRKDQCDSDLVISDWKVEKLAGRFASVFR